jgi:hypothetical protein
MGEAVSMYYAVLLWLLVGAFALLGAFTSAAFLLGFALLSTLGAEHDVYNDRYEISYMVANIIVVVGMVVLLVAQFVVTFA